MLVWGSGHDPLDRTIWFHEWVDHRQSRIAYARLMEFRDQVATRGYKPDPNISLTYTTIGQDDDDDNRDNRDNRDDRGRNRSGSARRRNRSGSNRRRNRSASRRRDIDNDRTNRFQLGAWDQERFDGLMDSHGIDDMGRQSLHALMFMGERGERQANHLLEKLASKGSKMRNKSKWLHASVQKARWDIRETEEAENHGWIDRRFWG